MRTHSFLHAALIAAGVSGSLLVAPRDARACGGCFAPPQENDSVVTDHRMILSVSPKQTTLWDQIRYSGSPSSFAWVLPVSDSNVATVGLSADVVFGALDALTATKVQQPPLNCPPATDCNRGGLFGGSSDSAPSAAGAGDEGVQVNKQQVVGPYDVAFLHATDATALDKWLADHGFSIPAAVQPVIGAYVDAKYDFIAMKLVPGQGVSAMRPVRVTTPGAAPVLPLRMVAAGTGPIVSITLWVLGEGRWDPQNFSFFTITSDQITWDWTKQASDYATLRDQKNADTHNTQWELESVLPLSTGQLSSLIRYGGTPYGAGPSNAGADYAPIDPSDAGPGESADQVREEDVTALFDGMNASDVQVTRVRADLAHESLASDLVLQASQAGFVSNVRLPTKEANEPLCPVYSGCQVVGQAPRSQVQNGGSVMALGTGATGKGSFSCASTPGAGRGAMGAALAAALGLLAVVARRRRR